MNNTEYYNDLNGRARKVLSDTDWNKKYSSVITRLDKLWDVLIDLQTMPQLYRKNTKNMRKWREDITVALNKIYDALEILDKYSL